MKIHLYIPIRLGEHGFSQVDKVKRKQFYFVEFCSIRFKRLWIENSIEIMKNSPTAMLYTNKLDGLAKLPGVTRLDKT